MHRIFHTIATPIYQKKITKNNDLNIEILNFTKYSTPVHVTEFTQKLLNLMHEDAQISAEVRQLKADKKATDKKGNTKDNKNKKSKKDKKNKSKQTITNDRKNSADGPDLTIIPIPGISALNNVQPLMPLSDDLFWQIVADLNWRDKSDVNLNGRRYGSIINRKCDIVKFMNFINLQVAELQKIYKDHPVMQMIDIRDVFFKHIVLKGREFYLAVIADPVFAEYILDDKEYQYLNIA